MKRLSMICCHSVHWFGPPIARTTSARKKELVFRASSRSPSRKSQGMRKLIKAAVRKQPFNYLQRQS